MCTKWVAWLAVGGDLRFLSHQETVRLLARAAARAHVNLKYSQGFNPKCKLSLPLPRPVGVASDCEPLLIELAEPASRDWADALAGQLPDYVRLRCVEPVATGRHLRVSAAHYEMDLSKDDCPVVRNRLEELNRADTWPVPRRVKGPRRGKDASFDVKEHIDRLELHGQVLRFALPVRNGPGGRCADVARLLGMAPPDSDAAGASEPLARIRRTAVDYRIE